MTDNSDPLKSARIVQNDSTFQHTGAAKVQQVLQGTLCTADRWVQSNLGIILDAVQQVNFKRLRATRIQAGWAPAIRFFGRSITNLLAPALPAKIHTAIASELSHSR
jgi:hypothetical protein